MSHIGVLRGGVAMFCLFYGFRNCKISAHLVHGVLYINLAHCPFVSCMKVRRLRTKIVKKTLENLMKMYSEMYIMSLQIFRVSVLFIAQNYGRIKCLFCSLINLFQKINMRIIHTLM